MLEKVNAYYTIAKQRLLAQLSRKTSHTALTGLCCISISAEELKLAYMREIAGKKTLELCESHSFKNNTELLSILSALVKNNQLNHVPCSLMLGPEDYQLIVTDTLPVNASEFQAAIRWKIKDLIHFPLDDAVIDSFLMPKMKINQNKIMVVAAQASKLTFISDQIRHSGLDLKFIDIPELGLRNITVLYEKGEQTTALIYVQEKNIQLLIISGQQIYVSRNLKSSLSNKDASMDIERLAAEIQRSFDYYQTLWELPVPSHFIFASTKPIDTEVTTLLSQRIKAPVEIINIMDILVCKQQIDFAQQGKYLPVIGGALRESSIHETRD